MVTRLALFFFAASALIAIRNQGIMTAGEKRVFEAKSKMIVRTEPSGKSTKERTLANGALVLGVLVGNDEKIQGKVARWLAVGGITVDQFIFSGFMTDVTSEYEYKRDSCALRAKILECETGKYPVDANIQIHISKETCGKKVGSVVLDFSMEAKGPDNLAKALAKVNDEIDIYIRKKDGTAVQVDYLGAPIECS